MLTPLRPHAPHTLPRLWWKRQSLEIIFKNALSNQLDLPVHYYCIYDGHSIHWTIRLMEMAIVAHVIILKLLPHTSHTLQPLDMSVFKKLKIIWTQELVKPQRKHVDCKLLKWKFQTQLLLSMDFKKLVYGHFRKRRCRINCLIPLACSNGRKQLNLNNSKTTIK